MAAKAAEPKVVQVDVREKLKDTKLEKLDFDCVPACAAVAHACDRVAQGCTGCAQHGRLQPFTHGVAGGGTRQSGSTARTAGLPTTTSSAHLHVHVGLLISRRPAAVARQQPRLHGG